MKAFLRLFFSSLFILAITNTFGQTSVFKNKLVSFIYNSDYQVKTNESKYIKLEKTFENNTVKIQSYIYFKVITEDAEKLNVSKIEDMLDLETLQLIEIVEPFKEEEKIEYLTTIYDKKIFVKMDQTIEYKDRSLKEINSASINTVYFFKEANKIYGVSYLNKLTPKSDLPVSSKQYLKDLKKNTNLGELNTILKKLTISK